MMHQLQAENLKKLVLSHKKSCVEKKGEDCGIMLYPIGQLYSKILDRELTQEELDIFN